MRILRVAQKIFPEHTGGGSYHVHALSRDQAAMGHDVTVLTVGEGPQIEQRDGYEVRRYPSLFSPLGNDFAPGVWRGLREAGEYDVVHSHSHLYLATNMAAIRRSLGDTPLAITNHGLYSQTASEYIFDLYLRTLGRWTFNRSDMVFCYTEGDRTRLQEFGVKSIISVVPNGVDTSRFRPSGPSSDLIDHDGPVVLFVGRLVPGKRPLDAVKAVQRLPADLNVKCYVVGDGPQHEEIESYGRGNVELLGHVPYQDMPAIYRSGNLLILPSRTEGFPRTILEAFASGLPVVSSHLEHTAPVVREGGETVPVGDIEGYTEALIRVLENQELLGKRARETVTADYTWDKTVERTTKILKEIS